MPVMLRKIVTRQTCGCEDAVKPFLNPLALSMLSIKAHSLHTTAAPPGRTKAFLGCLVFAPALHRWLVHMCCARQPVKSNMLLLLALLLLSYGIGNSRCSTVPEKSADMLSLLDFKQSITVDPEQVLSNWTPSTPHCHWTGVKCSLTHTDRVVALDLAGHSLTGTLTPSLGNLKFLRVLNLSSNHFSGHVPDLSNLRKLEILNLSRNSLQGVIPESLSKCSNLRKLILGDNNLTGVIPPSLSDTQLETISLPFNQLTGSIPSELGRLSNLTDLHIGFNKLSGGFPKVILSMPSLTSLDLDSNLLHGKLPPNIGDALPNLVKLQLDNNTFEGQIPASLGNASDLGFIDLSRNKFAGKIPTSIGRLARLTFLSLESNKLETPDRQSWEFLYALRNCTNLTVLALDSNRLSGAIPDYIGELSTKLTHLLLDDNNLSGKVPPSIANYTRLINLGLSENSLIGTIGEWIGMQKDLQNLGLEKNNFSGPIPSSIGNLTQLAKLSLAKNNFTGTIPTSLAHLKQLSRLDLSNNNLQGNLPLEVFSIPTLIACVLSYNELEGPVPPEAGHVTQLTELRLSSNKISGEIPSSLGQCQGLQILELDRNALSGSIPMSFGNLTSLSLLNLSHNDLSGFIPATISGLKDLTNLDLSYNYLRGEIPPNGIFANATSVSLNGNTGLCGGPLVLGMPPCSLVSRRLETRYYLIRVLIPIFGFMSLVLLIYFIFLERKMPRAYIVMPYFAEKFPKVSYMDLAQATANFSNLVGKGSYGSVYRGKLTPSKREVAVKVLDLEVHGAEKSFLSECEALRGIKHRNLLPIVTACSTVLDSTGTPFKALVYPFMPNGNLDSWLHPKVEEKAQKHPSLTQRISIAVDIADALNYLHNDIRRPIIHCDLKPSNILLDDDMTAHLGDFGIASFYVNSTPASVEDPHTVSSRCIASIGVKGTIGYIAPEYGGGGPASTYGDVYSFGIVLLEMLTGKRPTDPIFANGLNIVDFVERSFPDKILDIVDPSVHGEPEIHAETNTAEENRVYYHCLRSLLQVALSCTCQIPRERMNMREVSSKLHSIKMSSVGGKGEYAALK